MNTILPCRRCSGCYSCNVDADEFDGIDQCHSPSQAVPVFVHLCSALSLSTCVCVCACCPLLSIAPLCALLSCRISALPVSIQGHVHWKSALWCCSRLRHSACHCVSVHVGTCSRCPWALALVRCCIMHRRRMCSDWRFVHAWCMSGIELGIEFGTAGLQGAYLGTAEWAVRLKFQGARPL